MEQVRWALLALDLLDTLLVLYDRSEAAKQKIAAVRAKVQQMVDEGRDPTPEEFTELAIGRSLLDARLDAALASAEGDDG